MSRIQTDFNSGVVQARDLLREGREIPPGLVAEEVQRSWLRSLKYGLREEDSVLMDSPTPLSQHHLNEAYRGLLEHAEPELQRLFAALGGAHWVLACLEASGTIIKTLSKQNEALRGLATVLRPGLNISEKVAGTNGPSLALTEQRPVIVRGREHFLEELGRFACVAVPIFSPAGALSGVLNASRHHYALSTNALELLALTARAIENRMIMALPNALHVRLHYSAELLATPVCGLLAIGGDGSLLGANPLARQLLELDLLPAENRNAETIFECELEVLFDILNKRSAVPSVLNAYNGVSVFVCSAAQVGSHRSVVVSRGRKRVETNLPTARVAQPSMLADAQLRPHIAQAMRAFVRGLPILITGETGTGKEVLARQLHDCSERAAGPFVAVNCSAIPSGLIESELFGYDDGAFTGARRGGQVGRFEQANGGTLFLDEIGDMPLELQARLLRVLQERALTRLGSTRRIALDFSLICATHRDLDRRIAREEFRQDLYYRIKGLHIALPALRERSDLDALIDHFLAQESRAAPLTLSAAARACLHQHDWPGNIRELEQVLRRGAALAEDEHIDLVDLPAELTAAASGAQLEPLSDDSVTLQQTEAGAVQAALVLHEGNVSAAAKALGIARATLYRKIRRYGLSLEI